MRRGPQHCRGTTRCDSERCYDEDLRSCWLWFLVQDDGDWIGVDGYAEDERDQHIGAHWDEPKSPADLLADDWEVMP
jgi:hypothetical protein